MYSFVGMCIAVQGHVQLCRVMYSSVGPCIAKDGHV